MQYGIRYTRRRLGKAAIGVLAVAAMVGSGTPAAQAQGPTGPVLYITNSANFGGGAIANITRFVINTTGTIAPVESVDVGAGSGARSMVFTPDRRFAYLANTNLNELLILKIQPGGTLEEIGSVATHRPWALAIAPNGRTIYANNLDTESVSAFKVDPVTGALSPHGPFDTGVPNSRGVAVTPDGRFLYVSHGTTTDTERSAITGFALQSDGDIGALVAKEPIGISGAETVITPDGRFLYVVNQLSNDVYGFRIGTLGGLTLVPGAPYPTGDFPEGAAVSPDGNRLYVAAVGIENNDHTFPGGVAGFSIGLDGQLTESIPRIAMNSPIGIGFTPDGRFMYVSDFTESEVRAFSVRQTGQPALIQTIKSQGNQPAFHSVNILPSLP